MATETLMGLVRDESTELVEKARDIRIKEYGHQLTYSKSIFLPLTKQCRNWCTYCGFVSDSEKTWMDQQAIHAVLSSGSRYNVSEALFSMGEKPEEVHQSAVDFLKSQGCTSTIEYTRNACATSLYEYNILPHTNAGYVEYDELKQLSKVNASMGLMLESTAKHLTNKGEVHEFAPYKDPSYRIETITNAGKLKIPFTSGILIGIGETLEDRIDSLRFLADIHRQYGHLQEIIVQNFKPLPKTPLQHKESLPLDEILQTVALARIIMPKEVSIQVPPNLMGNFLTESIMAGANDLGGMSPITIDFINFTSPWPNIEKLQEQLATNKLYLRERLPVYKQFIKWTEKPIQNIIERDYQYVTEE